MRKILIAAIIVAASGPAFAQRVLNKVPPVTDRIEVSGWSTPGRPEGNGNIADGGAGSGGGGRGE